MLLSKELFHVFLKILHVDFDCEPKKHTQWKSAIFRRRPATPGNSPRRKGHVIWLSNGNYRVRSDKNRRHILQETAEHSEPQWLEVSARHS